MSLCSLPTGHQAIAPQFECADDFSEGLVRVFVNDQWGYINGTGELVIPAMFDDAADFSDGIAQAKIDGGMVTSTTMVSMYGSRWTDCPNERSDRCT